VKKTLCHGERKRGTQSEASRGSKQPELQEEGKRCPSRRYSDKGGIFWRLPLWVEMLWRTKKIRIIGGKTEVWTPSGATNSPSRADKREQNRRKEG